MLEFELTEDYIELIKLLKVLQIAENGAMAKTLVENGEVVRNGEPESRKRAKIRKGEVIKVLARRSKSSDPASIHFKHSFYRFQIIFFPSPGDLFVHIFGDMGMSQTDQSPGSLFFQGNADDRLFFLLTEKPFLYQQLTGNNFQVNTCNIPFPK